MRISDWSSDVCSSDLEPGERHGQVVAQPEVGEGGGVVGCGTDRLVIQTALEHGERELLVVAADPGVKAPVLLQHGGLDLIEPVRAVALADDGLDAPAAALELGSVPGEERVGTYV